MHFNFLGPIEMVSQERVYVPSASKVRQVLALLGVSANHVVHVDTVIDELWGENPPRSAMTTTQTYVYHLRKSFKRHLGVANPAQLLETRVPGYLLRLDGESDADRFESLVRQGGDLLAASRFEQASDRLRTALALWRGPALADVTCGRFLEGHAVRQEELRMTALEMRIQADMRLGRYQKLIPELYALVVSHPLNELFHAQLMRALSGAGRRAEALRAYEHARSTLDSELGLHPSAELRRLQHEVLVSGRPDPAVAMAP